MDTIEAYHLKLFAFLLVNCCFSLGHTMILYCQQPSGLREMFLFEIVIVWLLEENVIWKKCCPVKSDFIFLN